MVSVTNATAQALLSTTRVDFARSSLDPAPGASTVRGSRLEPCSHAARATRQLVDAAGTLGWPQADHISFPNIGVSRKSIHCRWNPGRGGATAGVKLCDTLYSAMALDPSPPQTIDTRYEPARPIRSRSPRYALPRAWRTRFGRVCCAYCYRLCARDSRHRLGYIALSQ
ncbi:hypothetical protein EXIGLDRAFT_389253 [Exidia glandulosa HHB12029]|uniref:Uncharacterized protein n=1 Tax=Exidia glandulosa HHB12029 TaxID=1314781 RepID=A0A165BTK7_EXIGL|nr:hypothetical protein EXIGLDRAFT_389253 [Exidia glandulosa HHB12029]